MKIRIERRTVRWNPGSIEIEPKVADRLGLQFEIRVAEAVRKGAPDDEAALTVLGFAYSRAGFHARALEVDQRLAQLRPADPICCYNLACSHTHLGQIDEAYRALDAAVARGYRDFAHLVRDPDLKDLRADSRFASWLHTHRRAIVSRRAALAAQRRRKQR
ncbi:MAG: hypothetical protein HYY93_15840 [Planctomycetes bacterium]|nr:hypothetical protein [Planctomycetota bacterium]